MRACDCMTLMLNGVLSVENHQWLLNISKPSHATISQLQWTARSYSLESDTLKCSSWNSATKEMSAIQRSALLSHRLLKHAACSMMWMGKTQVVNGSRVVECELICDFHVSIISALKLVCLLQIFHHSFENESETAVPPSTHSPVRL